MDEPLAFDKAMADMIALMHEGGIVKYRDAMRVFKRHFLRAALLRQRQNIARTAGEIGIHRNIVMRQMDAVGFAARGAAAWRKVR